MRASDAELAERRPRATSKPPASDNLTLTAEAIRGARAACTTASLDEAVGPREQIAQGATHEEGDAGAHAVPRPVVDEMAALAQAPQVVWPVVGGVMVEVGGGEDDLGDARVCAIDQVGPERL